MNVSGLIQTLFFAAVFMIFIDGPIGWLLLYTICIALVISFALCLLSAKHFVVIAEEFSGIVSSGGECEVKLTIAKKGFCLLSHIALEGTFGGQRFAVRTALLFDKSVTVTLRLKADSCGLKKAIVERSVAEDMFGILRLKRALDISTAVAIKPREVEYTGPQVIPSVLPSDEEEREEGTSVLFGGSAGYEHRPYADGDSPKRINYKLSAKKQQLMVRLDESNGTESTNIVIQGGVGSEMAEQAYALARKLVMDGSPATVYYLGERFFTSSQSSLVQLKEWIAFRDFEATGETVIPEGTVNVVLSSQGIKIK